MYSAEAGSAWTLIYPQYGVVIPSGISVKGASALALPQDAPLFLNYINTWLELSEKSGALSRLYDYWILGEEQQAQEPRWSVLRNVLGW